MTTTEQVASMTTAEKCEAFGAIVADKFAEMIVDMICDGVDIATMRANVTREVHWIATEWPEVADACQVAQTVKAATDAMFEMMADA